MYASHLSRLKLGFCAWQKSASSRIAARENAPKAERSAGADLMIKLASSIKCFFVMVFCCVGCLMGFVPLNYTEETEGTCKKSFDDCTSSQSTRETVRQRDETDKGQSATRQADDARHSYQLHARKSQTPTTPVSPPPFHSGGAVAMKNTPSQEFFAKN